LFSSVFIRVHAWPFLMLLFSTVIAANSAGLSISTSAAAPGAGVFVPITFESQSSSVAGIQFDLLYDSSALSLRVTVGDIMRTSGKTLSLREIAPGQMRFLVVGLNQNSIADGTLIHLFANVNVNALGGTYSLQLLNVVASDPSANAVTVTTVDGSITVQGTAALLNAASLRTGCVGKGEIVTLSGACLAAASLLFDGHPPTRWSNSCYP
jgi:hypothetical protein